jgi:hypothetical protein
MALGIASVEHQFFRKPPNVIIHTRREQSKGNDNVLKMIHILCRERGARVTIIKMPLHYTEIKILSLK